MCEKVISLVIKLILETVIIFEKCRIELEKDETMKDNGGSHFKAICGDDQLRKCMGEL